MRYDPVKSLKPRWRHTFHHGSAATGLASGKRGLRRTAAGQAADYMPLS